MTPGFRPLGYIAPGQFITLQREGDEQLLTGYFIDGNDDGQHVVQCQDCPAQLDEKYGGELKREVVLATATAAEVWGQIHALMTGHRVEQLYRYSMTFQTNGVSETLWDILFGPAEIGVLTRPWLSVARSGDCGDVVRSLTELVVNHG